LPRIDEVAKADIAVVGIPFDAGTSYRPGARFGPAHIREASRLLRPYNPAQDAEPFALAQVVDAGDIAVNPFNIEQALAQIEAGATELIGQGMKLVTLGGDHSIAAAALAPQNPWTNFGDSL
jgi:agmatinase